MKKRVIIGFVGTVLDMGGKRGGEKWRPSIAMTQQNNFPVDRVELIYDPDYLRLAKNVASSIEGGSSTTKTNLHELSFSNPWDFAEMYEKLFDFVRSYDFDPDEEEYLINITTGTHVAQICWFLLIEARHVPGKVLQVTPPTKAQRDLTYPDYRGGYSVIDLDLARYDRIAERFAQEKQSATSFLKSGINTRNARFNRMIDQIEKVAVRSKDPVLLMGPTGAGKSHLARRIYELKKAKNQIIGDFVEVNCATLRGDQAMSTLFGHAKGAFTGAQAARTGLMRAADGGILFLDEIGELGLDEQAMCLRALEEKRFLPYGSDRAVSSDFQLLAGTNRQLFEQVATGQFREDLYARLNLWSFELPGLSERREDIEPNLDFELARLSAKLNVKLTMNKEARARFVTFAQSPTAPWSGNFRDLAASVTRMATMANRARIDGQTVQDEIERLRLHWGNRPQADPLGDVLNPEQLRQLDPFDRPQLETVIDCCRKHQSLSAAGRALFAASRLTKTTSNDADRLRKYLAKFGLSFTDIRQRTL